MSFKQPRFIDQTFHVPRTPVAVIAIGDTGEALLVRSILENLGAVVLFHGIGAPGDFLRVLGQGETALPYLVICAHGSDNGFVFGDFADGIDMRSLVEGAMPAPAIAGQIRLPGKVVVSTACGTGSQAFASAFLHGGVSSYIAPHDHPDGADAVLFIHLLFHELLARNAALRAAVGRARNYDPALETFCAYHGETQRT
jgi:hypothetical protein